MSEENAQAAQAERTTRRVVVAEDEALIRLDLTEMLKEEGYDVVGAAADGEEAIDFVRRFEPDLAILDVKMPKLDGITVAEQIAESRLCPVVMLTAFSDQALVDRAVEAGALAYIVKPFNKHDLTPTIEVAVSRYTEMVALEQEVASLTERLEVRRLVERAKGILQRDFNMTEDGAFRWIQKSAMDTRVPMRRVAQLIIDESGEATEGSSGSAESGNESS